MAIPANLTSVVLRGTFITPEGDPSTGTISFTPSSWLINSGANVSIPNSTITKTLGTAGDFEVTLPVTDDADVSPGDWVYSVSEVVDGVSQNYNILLPGTVGGTAYLADIAPAAAAGPEYYSLASSLTIGTVTTLAEGASATADITGLAPTQVLDLGIPVGATGTVASAGSGSVGTAAIAAAGDPNTGIYFPAADQVAITTGGTAAATFAAGAIANPTFTGAAQFPDGSASAPAITNTGDTDTGIFHPADNTIAITTGGSERVRVNSSGQLLIGSSAAAAISGVSNHAVQIVGGGPARVTVLRADNNANAAGLFLAKSRNTAVGSFTVLQENDSIAQIRFLGDDGVDLASEAARIEVAVDGAPGSDDMPGRLMFYTTADGSASTTERMRIDRNGLITGTGTSLGAWTAYTPTLTATTTDPTLGSGSINSGAYCQIGKIVHWVARFAFGTSSSAGSGTYLVSLPVASANPVGSLYHEVGGGRIFDQSAGTRTLVTARLNGVTDKVALTYTGGEVSATTYAWTQSDQIWVSGTYQAA